MNRRAFLRLTVRGRERVLDLSCERLYMRWVDARAAARDSGDPPGPAGTLWEGEPPLEVVVPTTLQLMAELEERLASAHVLRVSGREWLASDDFRREVQSRIDAFLRRGGRVE